MTRFARLQVSYSIRFDWANGLCGHVFQGRFRAMVLQGESDVIEVARYVHLNPVRITGLALGKREQRIAKVVGCPDPGEGLIRRRLAALEEFPWSSWRVYSGTETNPGSGQQADAAGHSRCGPDQEVRRRGFKDFRAINAERFQPGLEVELDLFDGPGQEHVMSAEPGTRRPVIAELAWFPGH